MPHLLGILVPGLTLADPRPELPAGRLGRVVDRGAQGRDLGARIEQDGPAVVEVEVLRGQLDGQVLVERVEVAGHRPPPAPVVRRERQDARAR